MQSIPSYGIHSSGISIRQRVLEVVHYGGLDVNLDVIPDHHRPHEAGELDHNHENYQDTSLEVIEERFVKAYIYVDQEFNNIISFTSYLKSSVL